LVKHVVQHNMTLTQSGGSTHDASQSFFYHITPWYIATRGLGFLLRPWKLENLSRSSSWFISMFSEDHRFYPSKRFSHTQLLLALQTLTKATFHPKIIGVFICNNTRVGQIWVQSFTRSGVFICTIGIPDPRGSSKPSLSTVFTLLL
jgi:hypothetical protein